MLPTATFAYGANVRTTAWQQVGTSYYLAMGGLISSGPELNVFQFNQADNTLNTLPTATFEYGRTVQSLAWQQIGASYYLAVGTGNNVGGPEFFVFQFDPLSKSLIELPNATFEAGNPTFQVAWQLINASYYVAISAGLQINILQFDESTNTINDLGIPTNAPSSINSLKWQTIGSNYYLAAGDFNNGSDAEIVMYQFDPSGPSLSPLTSSTFENGATVNSIAWQQINSTYYLAVGSADRASNPEVYVLQFDSTTSLFNELPTATFEYGANVISVAWQEINSSYYLAFSGANNASNPEIMILEFNPASGLLSAIPTATFEYGANVISVTWQQIGSSAYLAMGGNISGSNPNVRVLQFECPSPTPTPTPSSETNDFTQALIAKYSARVLATQSI